MNSHCRPDPSIAMTLSVEHTPLSLRLPAGAVIFTVRGETWITQERVAGDIILGPGERYDVSSRAQIVISATGQSAVVHVVEPESALARCARDVHDYARRLPGRSGVRRWTGQRRSLRTRSARPHCDCAPW